MAFLDLRKAFDSLDHHILLSRLHGLGVGGGAFHWFTNYLSNRYQRVKLHHSYSTWGLVRSGIPQGSALGPLLFLVYVNDMPSQIKYGWLLQYTDDTGLLCSGTTSGDVHRLLSEDLLCLTHLISRSKMCLNIEKSSVMWFRPRSLVNSPLEDIVVDGTCLNTVKTQKYLGITFDDSLQWAHHTSAICKQLSFYLFWINFHRRDLPDAVIKMLVDSLVLSRINYALPAWGLTLSGALIQCIQRLLNWGFVLLHHCESLTMFLLTELDSVGYQ